MAEPRFVLATRNAHKLREFARMLPGVALDALPPEVQMPPETGETYEDNARIKARTAVAATGRPAIADDSGVEAAALDGAPGVRSARYGGPGATDADNLAKLRAEAPAGSGLRYVCAIVHLEPTGAETVVVGTCSGTLAEAPRGERGFGYDPVFLPDDVGDGRTMAELTDEEKDAISHRGRAARALMERLGIAG